jgi:glycosyltransferase involved in cell wall biosynthesis
VFALTFAVHLAWRLWQWRDRYDLVQVHGYPPLFFIPLTALRLARKPSVQTMSMAGSDNPDGLFRGRLGPVRRWTYRWITAKVAVARTMLPVGERDTAASGRVEWIPYGVNTKRFRPATTTERAELRARLGIQPHQRVVLFVGAITARKGVQGLIRVWQELAPRWPDARLWLAGTMQYLESGAAEAEPEYVREAKRLAAAPAVAGRIEFLGGRTDVPELMQAADLFCLPSQREGLPNVLLEAHAAGVPCVAYNVSGVAEIIQPGETGDYVAEGDQQALRECLERLLGDDELRHRMSVRCRQVATERFALEKIVQAYHELYESILTN